MVDRGVRWLFAGALTACHAGSPEPPAADDLERGGVYVAYNLGCEEGCRDVARGDVILTVDGANVSTRDDLLATHLTDGRAVDLGILRPGETTPRNVTIRARPRDNMPPLEDAPPFWTVGSAALDRAPSWARAPMFSHALPAIGLVHVDGGWLSGRDLYGRETLIVVWPDISLWDREYLDFRDQQSTFYRVLQKAEADLKASGVGIVFAVCGGANDTTVRAELEKMGERDEQGEPLPPLPVYRCPGVRTSRSSTKGSQIQATASSPSRHVGLENSAQSFYHYIRGYPVVVVVDRGGIVRWHSSGFHEGPQNTILSAVMFALRELEQHPA